jgi:hypothetical protein
LYVITFSFSLQIKPITSSWHTLQFFLSHLYFHKIHQNQLHTTQVMCVRQSAPVSNISWTCTFWSNCDNPSHCFRWLWTQNSWQRFTAGSISTSVNYKHKIILDDQTHEFSTEFQHCREVLSPIIRKYHRLLTYCIYNSDAGPTWKLRTSSSWCVPVCCLT